MPARPRTDGGPLRICHVSQPTTAGVANVVLELVKDQIRRGWQVHLACPANGDLPDEARSLGATVHPWEATRSPGPTVVAEAWSLAQAMRLISPDVVLFHSSKAGLAGRLAVRRSIPTAFMPHSWSFEAVEGPVGLASTVWERVAARWTDLTICVSEAERQLGRRRGCLGSRSLVAPNGVALDRWVPQDRDQARTDLGIDPGVPLVVCVGRLARQKGQDVLLDAWPAVRAQIRDARLALVGDGPLAQALSARAAADPTVSLVGRADPAPWFAAADVVVLPSRWEGMPLVALEAMASGRAVIGTDVSGMQEALGSGDAIVPIDDPVSLAAALATRVGDRGRCDDEGARNRVRAESSFSVQRSAQVVAEHLVVLSRLG